MRNEFSFQPKPLRAQAEKPSGAPDLKPDKNVKDVVEAGKEIEVGVDESKDSAAEKLNEASNENKSERGYNYPEVMEQLKPGLISVIRQLRTSIEKGEYNTLISDDASARIPTLILRKIFKEKAPNSKELQTRFLALGRGMRWDRELVDYINQNKDSWGKSLIITEFIQSFRTLKNIHALLDKENDYKNYDLATLYYLSKEKNDLDKSLRFAMAGTNKYEKCPHNFIVGSTHFPRELTEGNMLKKMGGVDRRIFFSINTEDDPIDRMVVTGAFPEKIANLKRKPEPTLARTDKEAKRFNFSTTRHGADIIRLTNVLRKKIKPIEFNQSEIIEIQRGVSLARQDVDLMAKEIMEEIWN